MSIRQHTKTKETKGFHYHHIVPKHLGGTDDIDNLILLSPLDHAKAHLELYRMYGKQADAWAYNRLMRQAGIKVESIYIAPNKGRKFSKEVNSQKGRAGNQNAMKRPEIKQKHLIAMQKLKGSPLVKNFGSKNPSSKKLYINGFMFETIMDAAAHYDVGRDTVRGWLNGKKPRAKFGITSVHK
jgi:hypothetical protein